MTVAPKPENKPKRPAVFRRPTARRKAADDAARSEEKTTSFTVEVVEEDHLPTSYANHLEVSHGRHDVNLTFAQVPTKLSPSARGRLADDQIIPVEASARITIAASMLPSVIRVLQRQRDRYEGKYGKIVDGDETEN